MEVFPEVTSHVGGTYSGAVMLAVAALTGGFGNAWVVGRYLEGITRQPEAASQLRTAMFVGVGVVEALPIITAIFGILKIMGVFGLKG
nr:ATP synthase F0 subunit C [Pasteuria penetrans]